MEAFEGPEALLVRWRAQPDGNGGVRFVISGVATYNQVVAMDKGELRVLTPQTPAAAETFPIGDAVAGSLAAGLAAAAPALDLYPVLVAQMSEAGAYLVSQEREIQRLRAQLAAIENGAAAAPPESPFLGRHFQMLGAAAAAAGQGAEACELAPDDPHRADWLQGNAEGAPA